MINHDSIWSIEPTRHAAVFATINAALHSTPRQAVADDLRRQGVPVSMSDGIAVVQLRGPMVKEQSYLTEFFGFTSTAALTAAFNALAADATVNGILLAIDSPGGSVDGLSELGDAVAKAASVKPVIAQVDGMAASAAYYVASQASQIYANRMDLIGSIGTILYFYDFSKAFEDAGIKPVVIDTGEFKGIGVPGKPVTESHVAYLKSLVDGYFADFLSTVKRGRQIGTKELKEVADGRVFFAEDAKASGLIDGIRSYADTLAKMKPKPKRNSTATARAKLTVATLESGL